jgi:hypothetical protein
MKLSRAAAVEGGKEMTMVERRTPKDDPLPSRPGPVRYRFSDWAMI